MATKSRRKRPTRRKCFQLDERTIKQLEALQLRYKAPSESETARRAIDELSKVYRVIESADGGDLGVVLTDVK